ncbi:hypothetical protein [Ralstonia solanacearum]
MVVLTTPAIQTLFVSEPVGGLPYSDFKVLLKSGKFKDVSVGEQDSTGTC